MELFGRSTTEDLSLSDFLIDGAKEVVNTLLLVLKNRGLYPVDHIICKKGTEKSAKTLSAFLSTHGNLKLGVNKECLAVGSDVVYQSQGESLDLAFVLFRDGIQWIEFQEGFEAAHLSEFIGILDKYKELAPEAEEDLVTALWEANFPKFRFKAVDVYWQGESILDVSSLPVLCDENSPATEPELTPPSPMALMAQTESDSLFQLTPEEKAKLKDIISKNEQRDTIQDLIDVLSVFFNDQFRSHDLESILAFLEDEIQNTLKFGELSFAVTLLKQLDTIRKTFNAEKPWATPIIDAFFHKLTHADTLKVVADLWLSPNIVDEQRLRALENFLLLLPSEALLTLGPLLPQVRIPKAQEHLMKIIETLAQRNIVPLETLLANSEAKVAERLVLVLGRLKGERPIAILGEMVQHKSDMVRRQVLRQLLSQDPNRIFDLFYLIEDTSDAVRRVVLGCLGQSRSLQAEELLLDYLEKQTSKIDTDEHLLTCYRALGRCGSNHSIPFLNRLLFNQGWWSTRLKPVHRHGALIALANIETDEGREIIQKAAKSLRPGIRSAYRKVMEKK
jgi:hypothetical protein